MERLVTGYCQYRERKEEKNKTNKWQFSKWHSAVLTKRKRKKNKNKTLMDTSSRLAIYG